MPPTVKEKKAKEEVQVTPPSSKTSIGSFRVQRVASGVQIEIKSQAMEDFFKGLSDGRIKGGTTTKEGWKDYSPYSVEGAPEDALVIRHPKGYIADVRHYGESLKVGGSYNVSFLRIKGIAEGAKFTIPGVWSNEELHKFHEAIDHAMLTIFVNYMQPFNVACRIFTTKEQVINVVPEAPANAEN